MDDLPPLPPDIDWANVMKLGEEAAEAAPLLYVPEIAARMAAAGMVLRQMPQIMRSYARAAIQQEREKWHALMRRIINMTDSEMRDSDAAREIAEAAIRGKQNG